MFKVEISEEALKQFKKLDKQIAKLIFAWIRKHLVDTTDPRKQGKSLVGDKKSIWRYRIGDYRLLCNIYDDKLIILVIEVGHRREVYQKWDMSLVHIKNVN